MYIQRVKNLRIFIDVADRRNIELIEKWLEEDGHEKVEDPPYDVVVVNFPAELPISIARLFSSVNMKAASALMDAIINHEDILPLCDPEDYEDAIDYFDKAGDVPVSERRRLALKAMFHILSHFSKMHQRMGELFGMSYFEHRILQVVESEYGNGYILEALTDRPERTRGKLLYPMLPIYLSVLNALPDGAIAIFSKGIPIYASLDVNDAENVKEGDVLIYSGQWQGKDHRFVVASSGRADVIYTPSEEDEIIYGTSRFSQRASREMRLLSEVERLAVALVAVSPLRSLFVFDDVRTIQRKFWITEQPYLGELKDGEVLAISSELFNPEICEKYKRIIATNASREVKRSCGGKLLLRRF